MLKWLVLSDYLVLVDLVQKLGQLRLDTQASVDARDVHADKLSHLLEARHV